MLALIPSQGTSALRRVPSGFWGTLTSASTSIPSLLEHAPGSGIATMAQTRPSLSGHFHCRFCILMAGCAWTFLASALRTGPQWACTIAIIWRTKTGSLIKRTVSGHSMLLRSAWMFLEETLPMVTSFICGTATTVTPRSGLSDRATSAAGRILPKASRNFR